MKLNIFAIAISALALSGCANNWNQQVNIIYKKPFIEVEKGTSSIQVNAGDLMLPVASIPVLTTSEEVQFTVIGNKKAMGSMKVKSYDFEVRVPQGQSTLTWEDINNHYYFESSKPVTVRNGENVQSSSGGYVIKGLKLGENTAYPYWNPPFLRGQAFISDTPVSVDVVEGLTTPLHTGLIDDEFVQTITYLGMVGKELRFVYKEFNGDMIRSAFTQEFSYEYSPEAELSYKSAKFIVHKATPTSISFTVTQGF